MQNNRYKLTKILLCHDIRLSNVTNDENKVKMFVKKLKREKIKNQILENCKKRNILLDITEIFQIKLKNNRSHNSCNNNKFYFTFNLIKLILFSLVTLALITYSNCESQMYNNSNNIIHNVNNSNYNIYNLSYNSKNYFKSSTNSTITNIIQNSNNYNVNINERLLFNNFSNKVSNSNKSNNNNNHDRNKSNLNVLQSASASIPKKASNNSSNFNIYNSRIRSTMSAAAAVEAAPSSKTTSRIDSSDENHIKKLLEIVMQGLGLQKLPDVSKANISQLEYQNKYIQYLTKVRERKKLELLESNEIENLDEFYFPRLFNSVPHNSTYASQIKRGRRKRSLSTESSALNVVFVRFSIKDDEYESSDDIEEANLKLFIVTNPKLTTTIQQISKNDTNFHLHWLHQIHNHHDTPHEQSKHILNIKVYQLIEPHGKIWLDSKKVEIDVNHHAHRWIEFDVTKAVETWVNGEQENLGLEIQCDKCHLYGIKIIDDSYTGSNNKDDQNQFNLKTEILDYNPILNIIGRIGGIRREKRSHQYHHSTNLGSSPSLNNIGRKKRKTECYEGNTRCCRHSMEVVFKEIKDFSFIIQPKIFDAGYCRGRCPPRYNPAHHHAVLQSLIWKKDRSKAPRPCCAPSKLVELEVLHIDENDSTKLKVSRWNDMKVIECACS